MSSPSQRRCLMTSAVVHGGLLAALALLSAFSPGTPPPVSQPYVTLVPTQATLTGGASRGGSPPAGAPGEQQPPPPADPPKAATPVPTPTPPATPPVKKPSTPPPTAPAEPTVTPPPPTAPRNRAANPPPRVVPTPQNKPQEVDNTRATTTKKIEISPNIVHTPAQDRKKQELAEKAAREAEAREAREAREAEAREADRQAKADARTRAAWEKAERERREALSDAVSGLGKALAGTTKIEIPGPGGNGPVVISYVDHVQQVFQAAWNRNRPSTLAAKSARSRVSLTIRRDGSFTYRVLSMARIGDVDAAIARIMSQQRRLNPFPADLKGEDLEVVITFNLESSAPG